MSIDATQCAYLSEGGLHVIFRYTGTVESYSRKVLRVRKLVPGSSGASSAQPTDDDFYAFLAEAVGQGLLIEHTRLPVSRQELSRLNDTLADASRPSHRVDAIDLEQSTVVMVDDLASAALTIELKPKWAKVVPPALASRVHPLKRVFCRFCAHCLYKQPTRTIEEHAKSYCPLELYDSLRRDRALDKLVKQFNIGKAGNNLRVSMRGQALDRIDEEQMRLVQSSIKRALSASGVLERLAALQSAFDPGDIELVPLTAEHDEEPTPAGWASFGREWLSSPSATWSADHLRKAYALSAIFKDCSIMLSFDDRNDSTSEWQTVSVKLVDLDPKPVSKFAKWKELDEQIWVAAQEWLDSHKGAEVRRCIAF